MTPRTISRPTEEPMVRTALFADAAGATGTRATGALRASDGGVMGTGVVGAVAGCVAHPVSIAMSSIAERCERCMMITVCVRASIP